MPALRNRRHERFCQEYAHGPRAGDAKLAYAAAGFKSDGGAAKLRKQPQIAARVAELCSDTMQAQAPNQAGGTNDRRGVTIESLIAEIEEARRLAMNNGQASAALSAVIAKAKLVGAWVEKREAGAHADLTDEQLQQRIRDIDALLANSSK